MTPDEFERLKAQEKEHLRKLRDLKAQHRQAQRQKGLLDALSGLARPDLDDTHGEMLDKLTRSNIESEARFEVAFENAAGAAPTPAPTEADREALRRAEAEALVRQMKADLHGPTAAPDATATRLPAAPAGTDRPSDAAAPAAGKTIGRVPLPDDPAADPAAPPPGAKSIGRAPRPGDGGSPDAP